MAEVVVEKDLGQGAKTFINAATKAGFYTVATTGTDGEGSSSLVIRGWRGVQHFVMVYYNGSADAGYWWQTEHEGRVEISKDNTEKIAAEVAEYKRAHKGKIPAGVERDILAGKYEAVSWTSPKPTPVKMGVTALTEKIKEGVAP